MLRIFNVRQLKWLRSHRLNAYLFKCGRLLGLTRSVVSFAPTFCNVHPQKRQGAHVLLSWRRCCRLLMLSIAFIHWFSERGHGRVMRELIIASRLSVGYSSAPVRTLGLWVDRRRHSTDCGHSSKIDDNSIRYSCNRTLITWHNVLHPS